jgi:transcriptional regulator with XRE-family HTH domain
MEQIVRRLQFSGPKMREIRLAKNISRKELSRLLRVTPLSVYNWENGRRVPGANRLWAMAQELEVDVTQFFE